MPERYSGVVYIAVMRLMGKWEVAINKSIWNPDNYCSSCGIVIWSSDSVVSRMYLIPRSIVNVIYAAIVVLSVIYIREGVLLASYIDYCHMGPII